jgi:outer membrane protein
MRLTIRIALSGLLLFALAWTAEAQTKLAAINMNRALAGTRDGQKAVSELSARQTAKSKELEQKQNEILALQDQFTKGANTLSDAAKNALFASIAAKKKTVQREAEDAEADLQADEQKMLRELGEKILAVVQKYAHDNGYTMVVDVSSSAGPVLYASSSIDITKQIIELYDTSAAPGAASKPSANPLPAK